MADGTPLLSDVVEGSIDYKGRTIYRSNSGGWRSAAFIIGVEVAERFAFYGISSNLISYLTGPLGQSTATAAANVNAWSGAGYLLPLLGAFLADSFIGRYYTVIIASLLYILGLGFLTFSAFGEASNMVEYSPSQVQVIFFFFSLYLVALAQGGHKPCIQAFGADQFDEQNPLELKSKSSFFNWWCFGLNVGVIMARSVLSYIQDNLSWGLGFGIPCLVMSTALIIFLLGTPTYRFPKYSKQNPLRIEVEDSKAILSLVPIGVTCIVYTIVFSQSSTLFTKQSFTMDRVIGASFEIPSAAMQTVINITAFFLIPLYDRILVPFARVVSGKPSGITMLQRIGIGMVLSLLSMVFAALVETKRLKTALQYGLIDNPNITVPMSVWWLLPQYLLFGISDVFTVIGLQEFFYDQVPSELRSVGLALYLSIFGIGSFLSSFLICVIESATGGDGRDSWFSNNLNRAHLDYFYWLLAGMSVPALAGYLYFSKFYIYKRVAPT